MINGDPPAPLTPPKLGGGFMYGLVDVADGCVGAPLAPLGGGCQNDPPEPAAPAPSFPFEPAFALQPKHAAHASPEPPIQTTSDR